MATNNNWNNQIAAANSAITLNSGTNAVNISTDASATTVSVGTGAAVKGTTVGSTNSTSATTVQSGSGALNITSTNGAITMNSGTGTVAIGNDATAATYNFATGSGAKVVTLGTTNTTSSLALKYGTADFTLASATGTVMSALDTGEITFPIQPAFLAGGSSAVTNVTGDGNDYTLVGFDTEAYDVGGDFASSTFTAPVTAKYYIHYAVLHTNIAAGNNDCAPGVVTSNRNYYSAVQMAPGPVKNNNNRFGFSGSILADMDTGDTATIHTTVGGGTRTVGILYNGTSDPRVWFGGFLAC